jgi:hypothetical protein
MDTLTVGKASSAMFRQVRDAATSRGRVSRPLRGAGKDDCAAGERRALLARTKCFIASRDVGMIAQAWPIIGRTARHSAAGSSRAGERAARYPAVKQTWRQHSTGLTARAVLATVASAKAMRP